MSQHHLSSSRLQFQKSVSFDTYFEIEPLSEFHRIMTMEEFMFNLAEDVWPTGQRKGLQLNLIYIFQVMQTYIALIFWLLVLYLPEGTVIVH